MSISQNDTPVPYLSIVIPAYNEEHRIVESLEKLAEYLGGKDYAFEVIVSDDGSTDRTVEICREFADRHPWMRVLHSPANHGKGYAVRMGILDAHGQYALFCDADLATPMEELDGFWKYANDGMDVVIASRPLKDSHLEKRQPPHREIAGRIFNLTVRIMAVGGIHDTQCGFKLFTREAAQAIFPLCTLDGWSFDIEVLHIAQKLGLRIKEKGVHWYHREGSKLHFLRDGARMLCDLAKIRLRHRNLPKQSK